jgi:hypothetical protein
MPTEGVNRRGSLRATNTWLVSMLIMSEEAKSDLPQLAEIGWRCMKASTALHACARWRSSLVVDDTPFKLGIREERLDLEAAQVTRQRDPGGLRGLPVVHAPPPDVRHNAPTETANSKCLTSLGKACQPLELPRERSGTFGTEIKGTPPTQDAAARGSRRPRSVPIRSRRLCAPPTRAP